MVKRIGKSRRKTRHKLSKNIRAKGKMSLTRFLQSFNKGDQVVLKMEPSYQKGGYFPRFHGRSGIIKAKKGRCYDVAIKDINKNKIVLVHPVHLRRVK